MMDDAKNTYKVPTPQDSLESQIMDPNFPKNEREWWASEEITRLRAEVEALRADALRFAWFSDHGVCVDMFLDAPKRVLLWTHDGMFNAWTFAEAIDAARAAQGGQT